MFKKQILIAMIGLATCVFAQSPADNTVLVAYNGDTAIVSVADNVAQYLTVTQEGAHVSIAQSSDLATEITYTLSGTTTDGEFYMSGSYKATVELNGLTLNNPSGPAINIQNGKRIKVKVNEGTTNTLSDGKNDNYNGCLHIKGHTEFRSKGTLNVTGNSRHAIYSKEYIQLKNKKEKKEKKLNNCFINSLIN